MSQGKRFLTDRGDEGGSVRWYIGNSDSLFTSLDSNYVDIELNITDCSKAVTLDFSCTKYSDYVKRLGKVTALIAELAAFRVALIEAQHAAKPKKLYY